MEQHKERKIRHMACNPAHEHMYRFLPDITYSRHGEKEQKLSLVLPWETDRPLPAILYIQGSGWTTPDYGPQLPQLCGLARRGCIVAMAGHRDARDGFAFPAFLQDIKCAIRFLRKYAGEYGIDSERIAVWGSSSGGNAALLAALTADEAAYETEEYREYSDAVCCAASCFAPTDLVRLSEKWTPDREVSEVSEAAHRNLFSVDPETAAEQKRCMSPVCQVREGKEYPPFLLLHGTADTRVEYDQMTALYDRLTECGVRTEAWAVDGAPHEDSFWSDQVLEVIYTFFKREWEKTR